MRHPTEKGAAREGRSLRRASIREQPGPSLTARPTPPPRDHDLTLVCWLLAAGLLAVLAISGCSSAPPPQESEPAPPSTAAPGNATPPVPPASDGSATASACAGAGSVVDVEAPFSSAGGEPARVYLPACYDARPDARFPVLYLLHGASADETQWIDVGAASAADSLIGSGTIGPMIIVMPDGGPSMSDHLVDGLVTNLVAWTDRTYRTIPQRSARAVGGISRGGRIALLAAGTHPERFAAVGGHSPAVNASDATNDIVGGLLDPSMAMEVDVGADDPLRGGVESFSTALAAPGSATEVLTDTGGHDRRYWRQHVSRYLTFYGAHLASPSTPRGD